MRLYLTPRFLRTYNNAPLEIQNRFKKQASLLVGNIRHPSLHAKKYDAAENIWQARINRDWRFYFSIEKDEYIIYLLQKHPK